MGVAVAYGICALVWGTTWFAIRETIGPGAFPTLAAAALRFSIASLLLLGLWSVGLARPGIGSRRQLLWIGAAGVLNALSYSLIYIGEESVPGGLAAVLFATMPLFTAVLALTTRTERIRPGDVIGALLALVGIGVIFLDREAVSHAQGTAVVLLLFAVLTSASAAVIFKRVAGDTSALAATGVFLGVTAVTLWLASAFGERAALPWPPPIRPSLALLYLAVFGSVVVYSSYFYLLKRVSLMTTMTLVFIQPLLALVVDSLWEHEVRLALRTYVGAAVTLGGVGVGAALRTRAAWRPRRLPDRLQA